MIKQRSIKLSLTDTGEDSELAHRPKRSKVNAAPPRYFLLFFPTRPSDEYDSKRLAFTFGRFRLYRLRPEVDVDDILELMRQHTKFWLCLFLQLKTMLRECLLISRPYCNFVTVCTKINKKKIIISDDLRIF